MVVDIEQIRNLMKSKQMDVSSLAARAGMSRQGLYRFLRPDYQPMSKGFVSMAEALGVNATSLILESGKQDNVWRRVNSLIRDAARGEARAFEVLPAHLLIGVKKKLPQFEFRSPVHHQLLAAAAELAHSVTPQPKLERLISKHSAFSRHGRAFFFASKLMSPERIVATTPQPMKNHLVFGSFDMDDFARHIQKC